MDQRVPEAYQQFSQPFREIVLIVTAVGLTAIGAFVALPRVLPVFLANPYLNGFILLVFVIGTITVFWQVGQIIISVRWIRAFANGEPGIEKTRPPGLLAPLAALLRERGHRRQISAASAASILDSVATRIEEARDLTRYIVNLLIFLGLLGTFYGLATTVPAIVETINNLEPRAGETGADVFRRLQSGLQDQMGGMGVAFASSLLGLAGSLVVGLLELFATHGQNRFYRELEEWMSSITRLTFAGGAEGEGGFDTNVIAGVLDHFAEEMDQLRQIFAQSEVSRAEVDGRLAQLADAIERMAEQMEASSATSKALLRVAEGQERLVHLMETRESGEALDPESRMRLRSIDVQMLRILEELAAGRAEAMAELRTELGAIHRALTHPRVAASKGAASGRKGAGGEASAERRKEG